MAKQKLTIPQPLQAGPVDPLIRVRGVSVTYRYGKDSFQAAKNANLDIYAGEFIIFFGPSGSGKSTLLYAISGLENLEAGDVWIKDKCITKLANAEMMRVAQTEYGFVFQQYNLIGRLNCFENVILPGAIADRPMSQIKKRAEMLLEKFGISEHRHKYPSELSGGQQQRIAISRSLINEPKIMLADEPVGNLDTVNARNVVDILEKLNIDEKITILFVTHDPVYMKYAHRVVYIRDGQIVRIQVNNRKQQIAPAVGGAASHSTLDSFLESFPELAVTALPRIEASTKARLIAQYLLNPLDGKQMALLEQCIEGRLVDKITQEAFSTLLRQHISEGGLGLHKKLAEKILRNTEKVIEESVLGSKLGKELKIHDREILYQTIRNDILPELNIKLGLPQLKSLTHGLEYRLQNIITAQDLQNFLYLSVAKGGVGLGAKQAKELARRLEVSLLVAYDGLT